MMQYIFAWDGNKIDVIKVVEDASSRKAARLFIPHFIPQDITNYISLAADIEITQTPSGVFYTERRKNNV